MLVGIYMVVSLCCHLFPLLCLCSTCILSSRLPYLFDPKDGGGNISESPEDTDGVARPPLGAEEACVDLGEGHLCGFHLLRALHFLNPNRSFCYTECLISDTTLIFWVTR